MKMAESPVADYEVINTLRAIIDKLEGNESKAEKVEIGDEGHW